jgi:hypothetical protein
MSPTQPVRTKSSHFDARMALGLTFLVVLLFSVVTAG